MIFKNKRDMESWVRERSVDTMKENPYLIENDFVEVASNGYFYRIVKNETNIRLVNGLYAELQPFLKASKDDYGLVKIGTGLNVSDGVVSHPDKHLPGEIATDENNRFVTDIQINSWNNKLDTTVFNESIDKIIDKAIKGATWKPPVPTFDSIATTYPEPQDTWTVITMDTNTIYMYDEKNKSWNELGKMLTPNLNFNNTEPCINEVGGISRGTTFDNVPIIQILNDMLYKKINRESIPVVYYCAVENQDDYNLEKYSKLIYKRFPLSFKTPELSNQHYNIIISDRLDSGEQISVTDLTVYRISDEVKEKFELVTNQIELEKAIDIKPINIKGENYILINTKKILSGSYEILVTRDKNKTLVMTAKLMNRIRELEEAVSNK